MASQNEHKFRDFAPQCTQSPRRRGRQRVIGRAIEGDPAATGNGDRGFRALPSLPLKVDSYAPGFVVPRREIRRRKRPYYTTTLRVQPRYDTTTLGAHPRSG